MGIPKRMAIAMSGLVFAGGAALVIGGTTSASAEAMVATPHQVTLAKSSCGHRRGCGCKRGCGCGRSHRGFHNSRNFHSSNQRIVVINRNNNISRSGNFDRPRAFRGFDGFRNDRFRGLDGDDWGDGDWND